ncbi:unnamed protein product [Schistosoma mattheei]|uniref:Uncharacterized protein n=1 Tax=Schistosoma mattheei TaxID=31246 RepID=A0A3P8HVG3_9TREM|nr:unnamed protein product [Schistosoma mattheei]
MANALILLVIKLVKLSVLHIVMDKVVIKYLQ